MKIAFLDRDGVINKEVNYLYRRSDFEFTEGCIEALQLFIIKGYQLAIVTNQAGIARGYYTEEDYRVLTDWLLSKLNQHGINVIAVEHCPHHIDGVIPEFSIECSCRKPKSGMFDKIMSSFCVELDNSLMVGDKVSDLYAAESVGIKKCYLVKTGHDLPPNIPSRWEVQNNLLDVAKNL